MTDTLTAEEYNELVAEDTKKKPSKYKAIKTEVDGITFDSKREAARYQELKLREAAGEIADLELQVPFPLLVNDEKIGRWVADFVYWDCVEGDRVYEDCKGFRTPLYRRSKKHVEAQYRIKITET